MCSVQLHILRLPALMVMIRVLIFYPQIFFFASGTIAQSCCKCRCLNFLLASLFPSGPPLYAVLCPDWIKGAGMTEHLILSFTARAGGGETWVTDQTAYHCDYCWSTQLLNTYFNQIITLTAALTFTIWQLWKFQTLTFSLLPDI